MYERTGWETPDWWGKSAYSGEYRVVPDKQYEVKAFADEGDAGSFYDHLPHYTPDYLLEKLPATVKNDFDGGNDYIILYKKGKSWYADYMGQFKRQKSDTPLKALLNLS